MKSGGKTIAGRSAGPAARVAFFAVVMAIAVGWSFASDDFKYFFSGWIDIVRSRGMRSWNPIPYANYTPLNIVVLWVSERLYALASIKASNLDVLKLSALFAQMTLTALTYRYFRAHALPRDRAWLGALTTLLLPTLYLNGSVWGQFDLWYVAFLVGSMTAIRRSDLSDAIFYYVLALMWKAQALFFLPIFSAIFLVLYFRRKRYGRDLFGVVMAILSPLTLGSVAGWMNGMPLLGVPKIYFGQKDVFAQLSMNAPNLWAFFPSLDYSQWVERGIGLGLSVSGAVFAGYLVTHFGDRRPAPGDSPRTLDWTLAAAILVPFALPKMHERYFIFAEMVAFARFIIMPGMRTAWPVVVLQAVSLRTYGTYLFGWGPAPFTILVPLLGVTGLIETALAMRGEKRFNPRSS